MIGEVGRRDDERPLHETPEFQFLGCQPAHDRLAGTGIVGDQEPDAGLGEQIAVDGIHLVRERIDLGDRNSEMGVVLVSQADSVGLRGEPELGRIAVQKSQLPRPGDLDSRAEVLGVEQLIPEAIGIQPDRLDLDSRASGLDG